MQEKRKYKRYYFPKEKMITLHIHVEDTIKLVAKLLNIGEGGVGLAMERSAAIDLPEGTVLTIDKVSGIRHFRSLAKTEVVVRWSMDSNHFQHLSVGCQFLAEQEAIGHEIATLAEKEEISEL
ncbi:PilZ domain-containing protein [Desulfogranum japonicum]|uniref:PilZ domain-containing protein n=1 Tax=Desulfogranum japonicum TaxID=231447 RepID=UPI0004141F9C|nr:PilZ domain-containing protein [Desulfogranum japonicum]